VVDNHQQGSQGTQQINMGKMSHTVDLALSINAACQIWVRPLTAILKASPTGL
jgi:hypothetical protein